MPGDGDLQTDALEAVGGAAAERIERAVKGAWMAGYDYVHVYQPHTILNSPEPDASLRERFSVPLPYCLPTNRELPADSVPGRSYTTTYDLTLVPDDVLRAAIRGDIDVETAREEVTDRG